VPSAAPEALRRLVAICETTLLPFKVLPGIREVLDGEAGLSQLRELRIEDLLGREPIELELPELARDLKGRCVLITGAGGEGRCAMNEKRRKNPGWREICTT
jgi:FlaA1/EpsC-like NDP-sugar epimerase